MLALATSVFGLSFLAYGIMIVPALAALFLCGIALGIFSSALVLRAGPAAEWFIWPIPALISPFVGVFYPIATLPEWMQYVAAALPPSYVFEAMRAVVTGGHVSSAALTWGGLLSVLYILLAGWFFTRTYRYAVNSGLLARYSAESVT
jgi:ABC-2 type transport system permease protein